MLLLSYPGHFDDFFLLWSFLCFSFASHLLETEELSIFVIEVVVHIWLSLVVDPFRVGALFLLLYLQIPYFLIDVLQHL